MRKFIFPIFTILLIWLVALPAMAANGYSLNIACDTCGFCPAPFGICLLYYIIALLAICLALTILLGKNKKCPVCKTKAEKDAVLCKKCGYNFDAGLQSTLALSAADNPELIALRKRITVDKDIISDPAQEHLCPRCNHKYDSRAMFCGKCGLRLK